MLNLLAIVPGQVPSQRPHPTQPIRSVTPAKSRESLWYQKRRTRSPGRGDG